MITAVVGGAMGSAELANVLMIALVATITPLLTDQLGRWVLFPTAVLEIALGILVGPAVLDLVHVDEVVAALAGLGLALLFFLAGYEVDLAALRGPPFNQALLSWGGSLLLGLAVGAVLALLLDGGLATTVALGLALATTALGMILPAVRDAGLLATPLGARIMAVGAVGEFAPIVAITLLFSGGRPGHATLLLLLFVALAATIIVLARLRPPPLLPRMLSATLGTSAQFAVRLSLLLVVALVWLANEFHLDLVLGAFAAGLVMRQLLGSISPAEATEVESKLEGVGFGVLIPFFFVTTGARLEVSALLGSITALALLLLVLVGLLLVRALPVVWAFRSQLPRRHLVGLGLYASTTLPLVVVIGEGARANGWLDPASAAALTAAAMLSVLLYPLAATNQAGTPGTGSVSRT